MEIGNEQIKRLVVCRQTCCWSITEHIYTFQRVYYDTKLKCQKVKYQKKCTRCKHESLDDISVEGWSSMVSQSEENKEPH
jgi:hypothetical protein